MPAAGARPAVSACGYIPAGFSFAPLSGPLLPEYAIRWGSAYRLGAHSIGTVQGGLLGPQILTTDCLSAARLPGSPAPQEGGGPLVTLPRLQASECQMLVSWPTQAGAGPPLPSAVGGASFLGSLGSPKATYFVLSTGCAGCQDCPGFRDEILHDGEENSGFTS
ncbi:hypothetical protein NDU88_008699 [Pleurodeles waltl]|uniref:Uncharacterized protein n=1 Tax=Pleurodeles waltl TaxID=8319 RepID=A0AAV7QQG7_PLEWA|nr:hypothetical protein NDU88_008699 [Pleurodeles waltl]